MCAFCDACYACTRFESTCLGTQVSSFNGASLKWAVPKTRAVLTMNLETIQVKIAEEMKNAQEATTKFGKSSKEAAMAWDVVEELEAEASHLKANKVSEDPLDKYCEESPEADECRVYED